MRLKSHLAEDSSNTRRNSKKRVNAAEVDESQAKRKRTTRKNTQDTPVKSNRMEAPETPGFLSPGTVFQAAETPKTPRGVKAMMNHKQSSVKPIRQNDALQLTELTAFKIDDKAYNSYLYTGKMKIPLNSSIAREDYASELGARQQRNIRIRTHPTSHVKKTLSFSDESDEEEPTMDETKSTKKTKSTTKPTSTRKPHRSSKVDDQEPPDLDASDHGDQDDHEWELDTSDEDAVLGLHESSYHQDLHSDPSGKFTRLNMRLKRTQSVNQIQLDPNDDDDDDDGDDHNDTDVEESSDADPEDDRSNDEHDKENTPINTHRGRRGTATPAKTHQDDVPSTRKRLKDTPHPILSQQSRRITRNALSAPQGVTFQHNGYNSNASTVTPSFDCATEDEDGFKIVPVVVKYPLMGSLSDWKDSFQTCSEETVMYRQICTWKCPYLLRYYGTHGPGIVFEFVDGESLDGYLAANEIDTIQHRWLWSELGLHITTALLYLHKLNISHNDIKPENVRYSESKKLWKLLDLGLATDFEMKVSRGIGTNGYRAPEVAKNGRIHQNSDVYGLGVMMEDALESIIRRYKVFERIFDDYQFCLDQYEEDDSSDEEVDVEQSAVMILDNLIRRRNANNLAIDVDNAMYVMEYAKKYMELLKYMRSIITATKHDNPEDRPNLHRLISSFRYTLAIEKDILEAFLLVRSMGIY